MMQDPSHTPASDQHLLIRIGHSTLALLTHDGRQVSDYVESPTKNGISTAANLREWLKSQPLLSASYAQVRTLVLAPTLLVPTDEFDSSEADVLYKYTFSGHDRDTVLHNVLPDHHAVVVFGIEKDLSTVVSDHFSTCQWQPVCQPVWQRFVKRQQPSRERQRLHVYFHDGLADVFSFNGSHFRFHNSFPASHAKDALYYVLNAFTQQGLKATRDEVMILGSVANRKWLVQQLETYVGHVVEAEMPAIQPDTSQWPSMPADLIFSISQ